MLSYYAHASKTKPMEIISQNHPLNCFKEKKFTKSKPSSNTEEEDRDINITSSGRDIQSKKRHGNPKLPFLLMATWFKNINNTTIYDCKHQQTESFCLPHHEMEKLLWKTKSTFSLQPHTLHHSRSTPVLPQYPTYPLPTPLSLAITRLEQTQKEMACEIDLMPDGTKPDTFSLLDNFMAAIAELNTTYLLFWQLPYTIWSNRPLWSSQYSHDP